jgi:hypothetical protein
MDDCTVADMRIVHKRYRHTGKHMYGAILLYITAIADHDLSKVTT